MEKSLSSTLMNITLRRARICYMELNLSLKNFIQMESLWKKYFGCKWYNVTKQLEVKLERCMNETHCLPDTPKIVAGLKASTANIFIDYAAYREFLFEKFV